MRIKVKCFNCGFCYLPVQKTPCLSGYDTDTKIYVRRYGQDQNGRHIEYMVCTDCDTYTLVQTSVLNFLPSLLSISSPYVLKSKPIYLSEVVSEANKIFDKTAERLDTILEEKFHIPSHVFKYLQEINLLSIDVLGLKFRGEYGKIHTTYLRSSEQRRADDIELRKADIKNNKGLEKNSIALKKKQTLSSLIPQKNNSEHGGFHNAYQDLQDVTGGVTEKDDILVFIIEQEYEWSDLQKMAFSYARRALVVGMYLQGLVPLDMYEQANGSFKSMQLQTGQTKEFQIEASSQSTAFLSLYYKDIDKDFIKTMFNLVINGVGNNLSNGEYYTFEGVIEYIRQKHELQELLRMASQVDDANNFMQSLIDENASCDDDKRLEKTSSKDKENKTEKSWIADIQFEVFLPNEYQTKMYDAVRGIKSASDSTMSNPSLENIEMLQNNIKYGISMGKTIENWLLHKNIQVPKSEHILTAFYLVNLGDVTFKDAENFSGLEIKNTFITSLSGLGQTNLSPDDIPTESVEIIRVAVSWLLAHPVH